VAHRLVNTKTSEALKRLQAVACDHRITACIDSRGVDQYHVRTIVPKAEPSSTEIIMQAVAPTVNYRVGLFVRVPEEIGSAKRPVNRKTSGAESRASGSIHVAGLPMC
jgi:hypothetical protein